MRKSALWPALLALATLVGVPELALAQAEPPLPTELPALPELPDFLELPEVPAAPEVEPEEPYRVHYGHGIQISGSQAFVEHVVGVLDELAELPTGAAILEAFDPEQDLTLIEEFDRRNATVRPLDPAAYSDGLHGLWGPGEGTDALLHWNPDFDPSGYSRPIIMGHELLHALYLNRGEATRRRRLLGPNRGTRLNELIVIGTDGYEDLPLSENRLRAEWNELYPERAVPPLRYGHGHDFEPHPDRRQERIDAVWGQAQPLLSGDAGAAHTHGWGCGHTGSGSLQAALRGVGEDRSGPR